jgi:hypothetical protein
MCVQACEASRRTRFEKAAGLDSRKLGESSPHREDGQWRVMVVRGCVDCLKVRGLESFGLFRAKF